MARGRILRSFRFVPFRSEHAIGLVAVDALLAVAPVAPVAVGLLWTSPSNTRLAANLNLSLAHSWLLSLSLWSAVCCVVWLPITLAAVLLRLPPIQLGEQSRRRDPAGELLWPGSPAAAAAPTTPTPIEESRASYHGRLLDGRTGKPAQCQPAHCLQPLCCELEEPQAGLPLLADVQLATADRPIERPTDKLS